LLTTVIKQLALSLGIVVI